MSSGCGWCVDGAVVVVQTLYFVLRKFALASWRRAGTYDERSQSDKERPTTRRGTSRSFVAVYS